MIKRLKTNKPSWSLIPAFGDPLPVISPRFISPNAEYTTGLLIHELGSYYFVPVLPNPLYDSGYCVPVNEQ